MYCCFPDQNLSLGAEQDVLLTEYYYTTCTCKIYNFEMRSKDLVKPTYGKSLEAFDCERKSQHEQPIRAPSESFPQKGFGAFNLMELRLNSVEF
ncbi:hypothetical protein QYF36_008104 [Acer negundo]|nr:hypothetical protein QYF36_008104 [Acer negundo]